MNPDSPLSQELLQKMNAYWRAANYLSVGQLYLCDNPLLRKPLEMSHVKSMLLGHWGTTPGQNFIYVHLNRVIKKYELDMFYIDNMHVRGYKEEGTITTYFDMTVLNDLDRFHLVQDVINRLPKSGFRGAILKKLVQDKLIEHKKYIYKHGEDMPEIRNWQWNQNRT